MRNPNHLYHHYAWWWSCWPWESISQHIIVVTIPNQNTNCLNPPFSNQHHKQFGDSTNNNFLPLIIPLNEILDGMKYWMEFFRLSTDHFNTHQPNSFFLPGSKISLSQFFNLSYQLLFNWTENELPLYQNLALWILFYTFRYNFNNWSLYYVFIVSTYSWIQIITFFKL